MAWRWVQQSQERLIVEKNKSLQRAHAKPIALGLPGSNRSYVLYLVACEFSAEGAKHVKSKQKRIADLYKILYIFKDIFYQNKNQKCVKFKFLTLQKQSSVTLYSPYIKYDTFQTIDMTRAICSVAAIGFARMGVQQRVCTSREEIGGGRGFFPQIEPN